MGLPCAVTEEARRIADAVEAADAGLHTRAAEGQASKMHEGVHLPALAHILKLARFAALA